MNDAAGAGLLAAVLADPGDDTLRLIYADWLDEHGEGERAEFIRVQCELAKLREPPRSTLTVAEGWRPKYGHPSGEMMEKAARWKKLRERERELLCPVNFWEWFGGSLGPMWAGTPGVSIEGAVCEVGYFCPGSRPHWLLRLQRGFFGVATMTADDWLEHADALLAAQPIREVRLTTWPGRFAALFSGSRITQPADGWFLPARWTADGSEGAAALWAERKAMVSRVLAVRWPGIRFVLPPQSEMANA